MPPRGYTNPDTLAGRFWHKVNRHQDDDGNPSTGCWNWMGGKNSENVGIIGFGSKSLRAHRVSWTIHFGPIPIGMDVVQICGDITCVAPHHLALKPSYKLTETSVREIRDSTESNKVLGLRYGVAPSIITLVRNRRIWKHVL